MGADPARQSGYRNYATLRSVLQPFGGFIIPEEMAAWLADQPKRPLWRARRRLNGPAGDPWKDPAEAFAQSGALETTLPRRTHSRTVLRVACRPIDRPRRWTP